MVAVWPRELRVAVLQVLREMESEAEPEPPVDRQSSSQASGSTAPQSAGTVYRRPGFWCGIPCSCCSGAGTCNRSGPHNRHSCLSCRRIQQEAKHERRQQHMHAWQG